MPVNPPLTPAQQALLLKQRADLLVQQNRLLAAQQERHRLTQAHHAAHPTAGPHQAGQPKAPEPSKWAIDHVPRPYNSKLAHRNAFFASLNRAQTSFSWKGTVTAAGGVFQAVFPGELDRNFWVCDVLTLVYTSSTQVLGNRLGWVSLRDNVSSNVFLSNVAGTLLLAGQTPGQRIIWPMPYPIGAGGSLKLTVEFDPLGGAADVDVETKVEGFWDFTHV